MQQNQIRAGGANLWFFNTPIHCSPYRVGYQKDEQAIWLGSGLLDLCVCAWECPVWFCLCSCFCIRLYFVRLGHGPSLDQMLEYFQVVWLYGHTACWWLMPLQWSGSSVLWLLVGSLVPLLYFCSCSGVPLSVVRLSSISVSGSYGETLHTQESAHTHTQSSLDWGVHWFSLNGFGTNSIVILFCFFTCLLPSLWSKERFLIETWNVLETQFNHAQVMILNIFITAQVISVYTLCMKTKC